MRAFLGFVSSTRIRVLSTGQSVDYFQGLNLREDYRAALTGVIAYTAKKMPAQGGHKSILGRNGGDRCHYAPANGAVQHIFSLCAR
jgi:hypothetical protein